MATAYPRLRVIPGGLHDDPRRARAQALDGQGASPRRLKRSEGLLAGYGVAAVGTLAGVAAGGAGHPVLALVILATAVFAAATRMALLPALASGVIAWFFYDGFIIGRHGDLAWSGAREGWWLLVLVAAATGGYALSRIRHHG